MSDPHVYHFVLTRSPDGRDVERLATYCIEPAEYRRLGALRVAQAIEGMRRDWMRAVLASYGDGWAVRVAKERGYIRSIFPGAALRSKPTEGVLSVPGQSGGAN